MPSVTPKNAEPPLVLAIDVGTTSVRAVLFDRKARDIRGASASNETPLQATSDGGATLDAEQLLERTLQVIDEVAQAATKALRPHMLIDAVAISTF
jgi:gluconokinase